MVFTSHVFLFYFLPLVLALYYLLPFRARTALIAVSSYVFYGWANPLWAVIMFFGSSVDYVCGLGAAEAVGAARRARPAAGDRSGGAAHARDEGAAGRSRSSPTSGLLAVFKYTGFVAENVNALARALGLGRRRRAGAAPRAAGRDLVLHVQGDELRDRRLPRRRAADAPLHRLPLLRGVLPRSGRRADHPLRRAGRADARPRSTRWTSSRAASRSSRSAWRRRS